MMNELYVLAIVVPCFNVERYIETFLNSVLDQTCGRFVCYLIDDGSTDNTLTILKRYAGKDNRFKVFSQKNKGVSAARNEGLKNALRNPQVSYVCFVDSDDKLDIEYVKWHVQFHEEQDIDFSFCNVRTITKVGLSQPRNGWKQLGSQRVQGDDIIGAYLGCGKWKKYGRYFFLNNKVFSRKMVENERFNELISYGEDVDFMMKILKKSNSAYYINEHLFFYRKRKSSLSQSKSRLWNLDIQRMLLFWTEWGQIKSLRETIANLALQYSFAAMIYGSYMKPKSIFDSGYEMMTLMRQNGMYYHLPNIAKISVLCCIAMPKSIMRMCALSFCQFVKFFALFRKRNWFE